MADSQILARVRSGTTRAWFTGGALLLASVVVGASLQPGFVPGSGILRTALFSAALLVFAVGLRGGAGSVTGRRPLGTIALAGLAIWLLLGSVLQDTLATALSDGSATTGLLVFAYADAAVQFLLAIIAVVQIGRAGVVPAPWNWVPAWALGTVTASWLLSQLLSGGTSIDPMLVTVVLLSLDGLLRMGSAVLLGVLAVVLADRANNPPHA